MRDDAWSSDLGQDKIALAHVEADVVNAMLDNGLVVASLMVELSMECGIVLLDAPWGQYNYMAQPGTWLMRFQVQDGTPDVGSVLAAYRRDYAPDEAVAVAEKMRRDRVDAVRNDVASVVTKWGVDDVLTALADVDGKA